MTGETHPFTSVDNGGPVPGQRLAEIREGAETCSIDIYAEELLWLLDQADEAKQLRQDAQKLLADLSRAIDERYAYKQERDDLAARIGAAQAIDPHMRGRWPRKGIRELRARDAGWNDAIAAVRRALQTGDTDTS